MNESLQNTDYNKKMQPFQLNNLQKLRVQTEQKISNVQKIKTKIQQMNRQLTYKGLQKINSVMMRQVQIKHTSEFLIKISNQYIAEVKCHTAVQNLDKRKQKYQQGLKNINNKIKVLQKKFKKKQNQVKQKGFFQEYEKSTVQVIGKNQQGDQIFNIIEVQAQNDVDVSDWSKDKQTKLQTIKQQPHSKQKIVNQSTKNSQKQAQKQAPVYSQTINNALIDQNNRKIKIDNSTKENQNHTNGQDQDDNQELDLIQNHYFQDQDNEQLDQIQQNQEESGEDEKIQMKPSKLKIQSHQIANEVQNNLAQQKVPQVKTEIKKQLNSIQQKRKNQPQKSIVIGAIQQKKQNPRQQKKQQQKPISKFKLQRMKQKLQKQLN